MEVRVVDGRFKVAFCWPSDRLDWLHDLQLPAQELGVSLLECGAAMYSGTGPMALLAQ
jgi:hypothetical protein